LLSTQKVALYIRVSTHEQSEHGFSIDAQSEALQQHCQMQKWAIYDLYIDRGISGKSVTNRPALQQLLQDAASQKFQLVLVWKINRLARNVADLLNIAEHFRKHQVALRSLTEPFETETPMGQFSLHMMAAVGELERKTIAENFRLGKQQRNKQGKYCGAQIFGYELKTTDYHSARRQVTKLTTVPQEAATVQHIFVLYAEGFGLKAIMNRLNRSGYTTKQGKPFSIHTIRKILKNPVYIGKVRYTDLQSDRECMVEGEHKPIISLELWKQVQQCYAEKSGRPKNQRKRDYLLTSLLRCPQCQSGMIGWHTKHQRKDGSFRIYHYYVCSCYHNKGSTVCKPNCISVDAIEAIVLNKLKELILHPKLLKDVVENMNQQNRAQLRPLKEQRQIIEKKLKEIAQKREQLFHLFEDDKLDKKTLGKQLEYLKQRNGALQAEQQKIEQQIGAIRQHEISFQLVQQALKQFDRLWQPAEPKKKRDLLRSMIDRITINPQRNLGSVQIHLNQALANLVLPALLPDRQIS
jgi:site-specific DNA recombinase